MCYIENCMFLNEFKRWPYTFNLAPCATHPNKMVKEENTKFYFSIPSPKQSVLQKLSPHNSLET